MTGSWWSVKGASLRSQGPASSAACRALVSPALPGLSFSLGKQGGRGELWVLRGHRGCQAVHKSPQKLHAMFVFSLSVHMSIFLGKGSIAFNRVSKFPNPENVKKNKTNKQKTKKERPPVPALKSSKT